MLKMHGIQILLSSSSIKQIEFLSNKRELNEIRNRVRSETRTFIRDRAGPSSAAFSLFVARLMEDAGGLQYKGIQMFTVETQFLAPNKSSVTSSQPSR